MHPNARLIEKFYRCFQNRDTFSFWKWSTMALGAPGLLLGWSPLLRNRVRLKAQKGLHRFIAST